MERKPRPELQRRRSQRQSNGSNFEADFRLLQDSDDDPMTSNDSGNNTIGKLGGHTSIVLLSKMKCKTLCTLLSRMMKGDFICRLRTQKFKKHLLGGSNHFDVQTKLRTQIERTKFRLKIIAAESNLLPT